MPPDYQFTVETRITSFAVTVRDGSVIRIGLNERAGRHAESSQERHVSAELQEYVAGERTEFTFPISPEGTDFDRQVWDAVTAIPYGETKTYGEIAEALGKPGAARAVGTANGRNPVPPVVPCHRVVAVGGKLGGYGGGLDLKRRLLDLETVGRARKALGMLVLYLTALLTAAACAEPVRPEFLPLDEAVDTFPPNIQFLAPPAEDSVFPPGSRINVSVRVSDDTTLRSVAAGTQGVVSFDFPVVTPATSVVDVQFPINVPNDTSGQLVFTVVAFDTLSNRAQANRSFIIQ